MPLSFTPQTKKILLQLDIHYSKFQEKYYRERKFDEYRKTHYCVLCRAKLHSHGWRTRYVYTEENKTMIIMIQRKRCPYCGQTYTLLPSGLHAFKRHSLEVIAGVIEAFLEAGFLLQRIFTWVDRKIKKTWIKAFLLRYKIENETIERPKEVKRKPFIASSMRLKVTKERAEVIAAWKRIHRPHHLYIILS